jgi:hypothetical protein
MAMHRDAGTRRAIFSAAMGVFAALFAMIAVTDQSRAAVTFTDRNAGLAGVYASAAAWGDYDNDGDLDILLMGRTAAGYATRVYRNDGSGQFTDMNVSVASGYRGSVAWGDYDNDGDLDIVITALIDLGPQSYDSFSRVYRNDGSGVFTDVNAGLVGVCDSAVAWGDYDNDGDLDILVAGSARFPTSRIYRNDGGGAFSDIGAGLAGIQCRPGAVAWGDYDNDGDLDVLLAGKTGAGEIACVYRNDGNGTFTDIGAGLVGVIAGSVAWGDYDNDGDLDILIAGFSWAAGGTNLTKLYRNDGAGVFTAIDAGLLGVNSGDVAWGDYDNDGDLDILVAGWTGTALASRIYRNDGSGGFAETGAGLPGVYEAALAWGDYDGDQDIDILLTGSIGGYPDYLPVARIYRNDGAPTNSLPFAPNGLSALLSGDRVTLNWDASTDGETAPAGLSYNLRIGTTPSGDEIWSAMADPTTGCRRVVQLGNAQKRTSWTVKLPSSWSTISWSVQAVDGAYAGSAFAAEQSFTNPVAVEEAAPQELSFALSGANPVTSQATFRIGLPAKARVFVSIHNVAGRRVAELVDGELPAGYHTATWDSHASRVAPGVYFVRIAAGRQEITQRIVVLQ